MRLLHVQRHEKAPAPQMPPAHTCAPRRLTHVDTHRCTQTSLEYTPPSSPTPARMLTHNSPQPHPTHSWSVQKHPSLRCIHTNACAATCKHSLPSPPSPHSHSLIPREPAPALLSTRDWPTRIRMLDARMERQKLSKMMERSDFINLRAQQVEAEGLAVPGQPGMTGHLPPILPASHLPPEGRVDGKQGEQSHAGHSTANHEGDRGGARQLQALGKMIRGSDGSPQWRGCPPPPHPLPGRDWHLQRCHSRTQKGTHHCPHSSQVHRADPIAHVEACLCSVTHALVHSTRYAHVCPHSQMPTATHPQAHVITVSTIPRTQTPMCSPRSAAAQTHMWGHQDQVPSDTVTGAAGSPGASSRRPSPSTPDSPGPWAAGPARQRWTGAGTGSGCGLPGSPGSGSSRCPSPLSWHLLGGGRGGMSPSPASWLHPQHWPLHKEVSPGKATPKRQAAESPSSLKPRMAPRPSTQSPCPTHALE